MAAAQRWARKGCAAFFQAAEVVEQHNAANRGRVAIAGPQHISSSAPPEFESMLDEVAFLAPGGVVRTLQHLRRRVLARHTHAMLKRGVTFVRVNLDPQGSTCGCWRCWRPASCASTGRGGTGTWSRTICPRPVGSTPSTARFSQPRWSRVQEERVQFSITLWSSSGATGRSCRQLSHHATLAFQTQCHVLGSLGLGATTAQAVLDGVASGTAAPGGARQRPGRAEETLDDLELAWLEWLRAAEAAWCRIHDLNGTQRRPFLGRRKGLVIEHVSLGYAQGYEEELQQEGCGMALAAPLGGPGCGQPGCLEEGADLAAHASMVSSHDCLSPVARLWPLGPRLGLSITGGTGKRHTQCSHQ